MGLDSRVHRLHGQHGADLLALPDGSAGLDRVHVEQLEAQSWRWGGHAQCQITILHSVHFHTSTIVNDCIGRRRCIQLDARDLLSLMFYCL